MTMIDQSRDSRLLFIGLDGGGTNTDAVLTDSQFQVLGSVRFGPSSLLKGNIRASSSIVRDSVLELCRAVGVDSQAVQAVGIGIAGISHANNGEAMFNALVELLPVRRFVLTSDVYVALAGATDRRPCVVLAAGTGSIAFGVNGDGQLVRVGGMGPLLSDDGSGFDIGRRALRSVVAAFDGRGRPTSLVALVCEHFGVPSPAGLPSVVYEPNPISREDVAGLATLVADEARACDAVASSILAHAGRDLGEMALAVIRRLDLGAEEVPVVCMGGVFGAGEFVVDPLRDVILRDAPQAVFASPTQGPAVGAARVAADVSKFGIEGLGAPQYGRPRLSTSQFYFRSFGFAS